MSAWMDSSEKKDPSVIRDHLRGKEDASVKNQIVIRDCVQGKVDAVQLISVASASDKFITSLASLWHYL